MKKSLIAIAISIFALAFSACANAGSDNGNAEMGSANVSSAANTNSETASALENKTEKTPTEITAAIMAEIEIPSAVEKSISSLGLYYDVDESLFEAMSLVICASGAYPDELAVFELKNESDSDTVKEAIQKRLDSQTTLFKDYTPSEMYKLDNAVIGDKGKYVYFLACADNARAEEVVKDILE
ncbi:MAG: DUF4358 domain-containing protein [Oscillospiraceae bacterium]|nr:DUF4358 domain-containing protein [Oscillospiraceae bacterium]